MFLEIDIFNLLVNFFTLLIYGSVSLISLIFTFDLKTYDAIDEVLNLRYFSKRPLNPLERNINLIDEWLKGHHQIIGPLLALVSLVDIKLFFNIFAQL